ncbi:MAG: 2-hydroxychromene-2-carboxylate isomerase [Alphaproteobacteria bacterium]|nr:2-hydroxychromene-2-carboxylate isomerase [Alphaproteobacteria bacterium]
MVTGIEFFFDLSSPPSFIAHERLIELVERTKTTLILRPVLVGGIFKLSGNAPPVSAPAKRKYMMETELPRLAKNNNIPLSFHADAPFNSLNLMRGAMVADEIGKLPQYTAALFRAQWMEMCDMNNPGVIAETLNAAGFDAQYVLAQSQMDTIKKKLISATEAAVALGVFGVPTFFLENEMFFGQEHLGSLEQKIMKWVS